jgi:hypothetical protein
MPTAHNIKFLNIRAYQKLSTKIFHMIINKQIIHTAVSTKFFFKSKLHGTNQGRVEQYMMDNAAMLVLGVRVGSLRSWLCWITAASGQGMTGRRRPGLGRTGRRRLGVVQ